MPVSHSQAPNQLPFSIPDFSFYNEMRTKRKLELDGAHNEMEALGDSKDQMEDPLGNPKRLRLNHCNESHVPVPFQGDETLSGCLKDTIPSPTFAQTSEHSNMTFGNQESHSEPIPIAENLNTVNMEDDQSHENCIDHNTSNVTESMTSMETDFVPDAQQYNASASQHTPVPTSSANTSYCGCVSCRGLKPSPVTGRFHCHCFASWRGMYGIDCSFYSDIY